MAGWHHRLNGHDFEQTLRDSEGLSSVLQFMGSQRVEHNSETEQQHNNLLVASPMVQWGKNLPAMQESQEMWV